MPEDNNPLKPGRSRMPSEQKDKIRAEQLARRLYKFANAKGKSAQKYEMSQAQVTAAKALIDKGKPSLQAIEQTNHDPNEGKPVETLEQELRALFLAKPELLARLNLAWKPDLVVSDTQQTQRSIGE